jgi:RHS repeat-associated protein
MLHGSGPCAPAVHMNGRVYDPGIGRFLSVDPVFQFPENTQSLNPYTYVLNSPLSFTDPTGYETKEDVSEKDNNTGGGSVKSDGKGGMTVTVGTCEEGCETMSMTVSVDDSGAQGGMGVAGGQSVGSVSIEGVGSAGVSGQSGKNSGQGARANETPAADSIGDRKSEKVDGGSSTGQLTPEERARAVLNTKPVEGTVNANDWTTETGDGRWQDRNSIDKSIRWGKPHDGLDVGAKTGTAVLAPADGKVVGSGYIKGYGWTVRIRHADGVETSYMHLEKEGLAAQNSDVAAGQQIGKVGRSGNIEKLPKNSRTHLHLEVKVDGKLINPQRVFDYKMQVL